ncbi:hypothetical protein Angca_007225 [Angiostrongylus cantonensis]|nr:hypothetical protein Angca_007225 [Angiostrongylus cantonensis]
MNSLVAKSYSSGGLSFINEESLCDDRRQSVDEGLESSSNPKCHTSNVFPDQNNCLIVEGVATVRHMRTAPLMSTSDCSDMSDVSDIDCRAHRGHSSSEFAPKGILRPRRLMTVPKQLSFDIPPSPVPSAKSSCVSQTGSYHMFERPARALRVRREPDRFRLALLQQRSNSESVFGITPPQERSRRLSVAHIPSRDQALLRKILGPQGLSWISTDKGEAASKKSISIGYSNDLEAHKMDDDSELPLMDGNQETISGGRLIKREILQDKKRHMSDRALFFAILGIVLMIFENELTAAGVVSVGSLSSLCLKSLIVGSTIVLVVFVAYFHIIEVQLFMNANSADDWRVALTLRRMVQIGGELFLCSLCPLPFEIGHWGRGRVISRTLHSLNVFVSIAMFFRLYWLCRVMLLHSRLFTDASSRSIAGLNRGTCASSMVVAVVARKLELTRAEKHVHNFMMDNQLTKKLKHSAANVLRETWLIYKFRKKVEKIDYARIRQHQRKFLVAIYEMRKVKRDQRKLAENFVSLGDIAKTSSNTYDLIQDVHSTQEGLSLRITAIEHQLSDISREIGALSDFMRSRKRSEACDEQSPSHPYRRRRETVLASQD